MTLYLIPTPIAPDTLHTLPRATIETARRLDRFIAERAKTARHFIKSLGPDRPIAEMTFVELSDNANAEEAKALLRASLDEGRDVGLLSEAGCPGVADPGAAAVAYAHHLGIRVAPLVGPSSLLLALMASGMNGQRFAFQGYLSPKRGELAADLRRLERRALGEGETQLFIETPYRSRMVMETAVETLQAHTLFGVASELTGVGEWIRCAPVSDWRRGPLPDPGKAPAVFMIGALRF
ncbi:MAG: SAM-dependent methyltransferase [Saprospiraceae bacterium]